MTNQNGFSLIEVVAALVIVGMLAAIASMGIVTGTRGYLQTKENTHLTQKAHMAIYRLQRELTELADVVALDSGTPSLIFDNPEGRQGLEFNNGIVRLYELGSSATDFSGSTGHTLVDQVGSLDLTFYNGDTPGWQPADGIRQLSAIEIELNLQRRESPGDSLQFTTLVHPRNNDNYGGAPTDYVSAPRYECFISGAAGTLEMPPYGIGWVLAAGCLLAGALGLGLDRRGANRLEQPEGNVLVGLVVVMLIFSALGAGMVSMTSTSSTEQFTTNSATRAYYLAESGFRYAASEYLNTVDTNDRYGPWDERNAALLELHNKTYRLRNNAGEFQIKVYPSFLAVEEDTPAGSNDLKVRVPGGIDAGSSIPDDGTRAYFMIEDDIYPFNVYDSDNRMFLDIGIGLGLQQDAYANTPVMIVGVTTNTAQTVSEGGTVILKDGRFFPAYNGRIRIFNNIYRYRNRSGDNTLVDIRRADDPTTNFSLTLTADYVYLEPSITLQSKGTFGSGDIQASRTIHYDVGLPVNLWENIPIQGQQLAIKIPMDMSHFNVDRATFVSVEQAGQPALQATSTDSGPLGPKSAEVSFDWSTTQVNFASAHKAAGRYLSYDAQFKMGFDPTTEPVNSWGPEGTPVPQHYMAGLSFRMDGSGNMLGVSFQRGANGSTGPDNITSELVPIDDVNAVVLWKEDATDANPPNWLAYAETGLLFADGAELSDSTLKWTAESPWTRATNFDHRGSYSWTTSPSGVYSDPPAGVIWNDTLESEVIDLSHATSAKLTFWTRYRLYSCSDFGYVDISGNGGATWTTLNNRVSQHCGGSEPDLSSYAHYTSNSTGFTPDWGDFLKKELDISSYAGNPNVKVRFRFFRRGDGNYRDGWWIDDVRVIQNFRVQDATLFLRLQEAKAVPFTGGNVEVRIGDVILQDNGAAGTVVVQPLLDSGTWAGGDAAGVLWLNLTSAVNFSSGSDLKIGLTGVATAAASNGFGVTINTRYNLIRAFYGSLTGVAPPTQDIDKYDQERLANSIGSVNWTPDEWETLTGSTDYYTLVEWNDTYDTSSALRLKDENGRYSIIAVDESIFYSPTNTFFPNSRPELGLHAAGHGTENVYFQDMAVQLVVGSDEGINPIQR